MAKICDKCGYKNNDLAIKCEHCGADLTPVRVSQQQSQQPPEQRLTGNYQTIPNVMQPKKKSPLKMILILVCVLLFAGVAVGGIFFIRGNMSQKNYKEQIAHAEKYLEAQNFDEAVKAFQMAIEANPDKEDSYVGLFQTYMAQDDMEQAVATLQQGVTRTKSQRLKIMLSRYLEKTGETVDASAEDGTDTDNTTEMTEEELEEASSDVAIDTSFVQRLKNYTYMNYARSFGSCTAAKQPDNSLEVTCTDFAGKLYFADTDENKQIVDEAVWKPFDTAVPSYVVLDDLLVIFKDYYGGVSKDHLQMLVGTTISPEYSEAAKSDVVKFTTGGCQVEIACDENGNIVGNHVWNRIYPPAAEAMDANQGHVSGVMINAVDGKGIDGVKLTAQPRGEGTQKTWESETDGSFEVDLDEGTYLVKAEKDNYMTEEYDLEVIAGENNDAGQWIMSPELATGEIRIVLEWGASPSDLDSYVDGTASDGTDVFISFRNSLEQINGKKYAELDVDEMHGYGPETVTIYDAAGSYDYFVYDYNGTGLIGGCGATVKIYMPGQPVKIVTVGNGVGNCWNVCHIEDGEVTIQNTISDPDATSYYK